MSASTGTFKAMLMRHMSALQVHFSTSYYPVYTYALSIVERKKPLKLSNVCPRENSLLTTITAELNHQAPVITWAKYSV